MAELTRGQKAARTRAANKAKKASENRQDFAATASSLAVAAPATVSRSVLGNFLSSLDDMEREVYGDVTAATVTVTLDGKTVSAIYDGKDWHIQF